MRLANTPIKAVPISGPQRFLNKLPSRSGGIASACRAEFRPVSSHFVLEFAKRYPHGDIGKQEPFSALSNYETSKDLWNFIERMERAVILWPV